MKLRIASLLMILCLIFSSFVGCSSSETTNNSSVSKLDSSCESVVYTPESNESEFPEESTSNPPQDDESTHPEEPDFLTKHGQPNLPEETVIPQHYLETETEFLYKLELPIPDAEGFSTYVANNVLKLFYWDGENQFCDMVSLETAKLIKRISITYDNEWGQFADGGFWLVDRTNLAVRFYDALGNETLVKEGDTSEDFIYCETVHITADKKYLVTAHTNGSVVVIYDLANGKTFKPEIPANMNVFEIYDLSDGIYFDGGIGLGALYVPETNETQVFSIETGTGAFYGDLYVCDAENYVKLCALNSDEFLYLPFGNFQTLDFGCAITIEGIENLITFWDLRKGVSVTIDRDDAVYGLFSRFLEDGTALIFEYSEKGVEIYAFDVASALKASDKTFEVLNCTEKELEQEIAEIAERIYANNDVTVLYGTQGNDFDIYDYVGVAELDLYEIRKAMLTAEEVLNKFPKGMLTEAYSETHKGLRLYLCADIYGVQSGSISTAGGVTTEQDGYIAVVLDIHEDIWYNIAHEFSHVFDNRIQELSTYDGDDWIAVWDAATPLDGAYVYSYDDYTENHKYTMDYDFDTPENVWFVDGYARTFPTEDRARLFEYMFMPQDDSVSRNIYDFDNLVNKAKLYSYILRQCFPSCNTETSNVWEKNLGVIDSSVVPNVETPVPVG